MYPETETPPTDRRTAAAHGREKTSWQVTQIWDAKAASIKPVPESLKDRNPQNVENSINSKKQTNNSSG